MSESQHTEEPWTCRSPDGKTFAEHTDEYGEWSADLDDYDLDEDERCGSTASLAVKDSDGRVVALVVMAGVGLELNGRHDANARLIAAAPDLLSVLQRFVTVNRTGGYEFDSNEPKLFTDIEAAIAKATTT